MLYSNQLLHALVELQDTILFRILLAYSKTECQHSFECQLLNSSLFAVTEQSDSFNASPVLGKKVPNCIST